MVGQIWPIDLPTSYAICLQGLPAEWEASTWIITVCCGKPCSGGQHGVLLWEPQGGTGRNLDVLEGDLAEKALWILYFDFKTWLDVAWRLCLPELRCFLFLTGLSVHLESLFWCYYFPLGSFLCFCGLYPCPLVYCGGLNTSVPSWLLQPSRDRAGVPSLLSALSLSPSGVVFPYPLNSWLPQLPVLTTGTSHTGCAGASANRHLISKVPISSQMSSVMSGW